MLIRRYKNKFVVVKGFEEVARFGTFEEAREYLATKGVEDAKGDLVSHVNSGDEKSDKEKR